MTERKQLILLGAGASRDAGLKTTVGLTHDVISSCITSRITARESSRLAREQEGDQLRKAMEAERRTNIEQGRLAQGGMFHSLFEQWAKKNDSGPVKKRERQDPLAFVYGRLRAAAAERQPELLEPPLDLEEVVLTLQVLQQRRTSGIGAFVREWDPALRSLDRSGYWITGKPVEEYGLELAEFIGVARVP